jgi:hypothetical protein
MANFIGGSAPAMAQQIADGYTLVHKNLLKGFTPGELQLLQQELDKVQRTIRAETPAQDDAMALQSRNRKIGRLSSAMQVIQHMMSVRRPS